MPPAVGNFYDEYLKQVFRNKFLGSNFMFPTVADFHEHLEQVFRTQFLGSKFLTSSSD